MALCRLCSSREQIFDVFHSHLVHGQQLRLSIFLATGIEIKQSDLVSKMVCHRCCEIAVKLHKYRINAISNDKLLKEQIGQPYTPPIVNQEEILHLAAKIASEQVNSHNENANNSATNSQSTGCINNVRKEPYKHSSIHKLHREYENIVLPEEVFKSDISPVISLNSVEVTDWYSEQASKIQKRLTNLVIKKLPSASAVIADTYKCSDIPENDEAKADTCPVPANVINTSCNDNKNDNDSDDMDTSDFVSNCQNENDASTINTTPNISFNHGNEEPAVPELIKFVNQKPKKKSVRKSLTERKRSFSDDEDEVIPEKKIRAFKSKDPINVVNKVDLPNQLPKDKIQHKNIFTSPLELTGATLGNRNYATSQLLEPMLVTPAFNSKEPPNVVFNVVDMRKRRIHDETHQDEILTPSAYHLKLAPSGLLSTSTYIATSPGPSFVESNLVSSSLSPPSVASGTTTLPPSFSDIDPNGLLFEHADREHIMVAEQTLSVFFCSVCNKLCDSQEQLKEHETVHLRCKFCQLRMKSIKSLNIHLSESCSINIVKNPPNLKLTKVEYIPEAVEKYPEAFEELFTLKDVSSDLEEEGLKLKAEFGSNVVYNNTTQNIIGIPSNEVSEVEVVCILEDSEDEVECTETSRHPITENSVVKKYGKSKRSYSTVSGTYSASVKDNENSSISGRLLSKSTSPLNEREMIHSLVMTHYRPVDSTKESQSDIVPKNKIWFKDSNKIMLNNFVSELRKHKISVQFEPASRVFAKFQKKPSSTTSSSKILESWVDKKVFDIRKPYTPYGFRSVLQTNTSMSQTNRNGPETKTNVILNGKQMTHILPKPTVVTSAQPTVNKPVFKITSTSNTSLKTTSVSNSGNVNKFTIITSTAGTNKGKSSITQISTALKTPVQPVQNTPLTVSSFIKGTVQNTPLTVSSVNKGTVQNTPLTVPSLIKGTVVATTSGQSLLNPQQTVNATNVLPYPTLIVPQGNLVGMLQNNQQNEKIIHVSNNTNTKYVVLAPQNLVQQLPPLVYSNNLTGATYQPTIQINQAPQPMVTYTNAQSTFTAAQTTNVITQPTPHIQGGTLRVKDLRELMGTQFK